MNTNMKLKKLTSKKAAKIKQMCHALLECHVKQVYKEFFG